VLQVTWRGRKISLAKIRENLAKYIFQYGIYIALVILFIVFASTTNGFLTVMNLKNFLRFISITGVMSMGMAFVIIGGGIDLSVGAIMALSAIFTTSFITGESTFPVPVAILIGTVVGTLMGLINGIIISRVKIAPFIVTLAMMIIIRGAALAYTLGDNVKNIVDQYKFIARGEILNIPFPFIIFAVIAILSYVVLNFTRFGRYTYMIGGNEASSALSGVNVDLVKVILYMICAATAAIGGVLLSSRTMAGQPIAGTGYELDVIAAVVIGGVSLSGGIGKIPGVIVGVLILGIITNGLGLLAISSYYQQVIKGLIIILAVYLDIKGSKYR
jgi:ribose/xylose/arabinose/galactoside ABC-type transport system permease subunit